MPLACTSGCTVGPGAEGAEGALVVVFVGALVGYLRAAEPAAVAVFEAEEPICWEGLDCGCRMLRCMGVITDKIKMMLLGNLRMDHR